MKTWKKYLIGLLICLFITAGVFYITPDTVKKEPPLALQSHESVIMVLKLTSWIYDHSSKLSLKQSYALAKEINKYDMSLLRVAIIQHESGFDPTATSSKGAKGFSQVMYEPHKEMLKKIGVNEARDLYNMEENIQAGHLILTDYLKRYNGGVTEALEAYVRGHSSGKDGTYVKEILTNLGNIYVYLEKKEGK